MCASFKDGSYPITKTTNVYKYFKALFTHVYVDILDTG